MQARVGQLTDKPARHFEGSPPVLRKSRIALQLVFNVLSCLAGVTSRLWGLVFSVSLGMNTLRGSTLFVLLIERTGFARYGRCIELSLGR